MNQILRNHVKSQQIPDTIMSFDSVGIYFIIMALSIMGKCIVRRPISVPQVTGKVTKVKTTDQQNKKSFARRNASNKCVMGQKC